MQQSSDRLGFALLCAVLMVGPARAQFAPEAIQADRYLAPDGSLHPNATIVLSKGKIKSVVPGKSAPDNVRVVHHPNAVVCPGLIDVRSTLGTYGATSETAHSIDPAANAVDLMDTTHKSFQSAVRAGVTTVMVAPAANNLISGVAVTLKTASVDGYDPVVRADGPLMFALGSTVWQSDRAPTSRIGSLAMLREVVRDAQAGREHERLVRFMAGRLDGLVVCEEPQDVSAVLRTFGDTAARFHIVHTSDARNLVGEIGRSGSIIVVGPIDFDTPPGTIAFAAALARENVPVVFAGGTPGHPYDSVRISAALAVRYGMSASAARKAMTVNAAKLAGVSNRIGALRPGLDADLVVFSDDPLRLDARIIEVYVSGVRVFRERTPPLKVKERKSWP